jgi:hypothetical protein
MATTEFDARAVATLEAIADQIAQTGTADAHGVVWSREPAPSLDAEIEEAWELLEANLGDLFDVYWQPRGGIVDTRTTVTGLQLPSGRTLAVEYYDFDGGRKVIAVITADAPLGRTRVAQVALTGDTVCGLPTSLSVACSGIVAVDAFHHGLANSSWAASQLYGEDEFCNADEYILEVGAERQSAALAAIEEHADDEGDDDGALQELHDEVAATPVWLYALDDDDWRRILALASDTPELPLYDTPPKWERREPHQITGDLWYMAAALLTLYHEI